MSAPTATATATPDPWDRTPPKGGGSSEKPPPGTYAGRLYAIVDLGTHSEEVTRDNGSKKMIDMRKLFFVWETPDCLKSGSTEPHLVGERYTLSLGRNAKYRKMLEGWRGKAIGDEENINPSVLLGRPCLLTLTQNGDYVNLTAVGALMAGQSVKPAYYTPPLKFVIGQDVKTIPEWLPWCYGRSVVDIIKESHEMRGKPAGASAPAARPAPPPNTAAPIPAVGSNVDDIPW